MPTRSHKWAHAIKAWADGEDIQFRSRTFDKWKDFVQGIDEYPAFNSKNLEWRVKPRMSRLWVAEWMYYDGNRQLAVRRSVDCPWSDEVDSLCISRTIHVVDGSEEVSYASDNAT